MSLSADRAVEVRVSRFVVIASAIVFGALLLAVPPFFLSFDEAKYIGIGYNVLDGLGPRSPFGDFFLLHAPIWSVLLVLPDAWFGIDPLDTGHVLNAIAGVGLVLIAGFLGWRVRPAVGAIAAAGLLGVTYVHDITRTARLDLPAAALALLFLVVGLDAVRRGGVGRAILAGAVFALAFLVKEVALPLAAVPVLAGILAGRPWRALAVTAGWMLAVAAIGLSWWFLLVADLTGIVYRLGTPAWSLAPIGVAVAVLAVAGILAGRLPPMRALEDIGRRLGLEAGGRGRVVLAASLTAAWCIALLAVFAGTLEGRGTDLLDPVQIGRYASTWLPGALKVVAGIGAIGVLLSLAAWRAADPPARSALTELWLATICSLPLVLLVVGVGEPPRNYLAQVAILAALAGAGWLWLGEIAIRTLRLQDRRPRLAAAAVPVALVALFLASSTILAQHALTFREMRTSAARAAAVTTAVEWVRANVPAGSKVAIGSFLSNEIAIGLRGTHEAAQIRHVLAIGDAMAPRGVRRSNSKGTDDWIALDIAPRNVNEFQGFAAGRLTEQLRSAGVDFWIYATEAATSAPTVVHALAGAPGVEEVAAWSFPTPTIPIEVHAYAIDRPALAFDTDELHISIEALERLVTILEADGGGPVASTAANLAEHVVVSPPSPAGAALIERLRALAGG
jgi:4-amino-4-deoxy-L-arabinose transferase-like glycosyltransferase